MSKHLKFSLLVLILSAVCCLALHHDDTLTDENESPSEPFISKKSELFRFSRSAKGGLFAKYEAKQRQQQEKQSEVSQVQEQPKAEVQQQVVAGEAPSFTGQEQQVEVQQKGNLYSAPVSISQPVISPISSQQSASQSSSSKSSSNSLAKTITTTTTTTELLGHQHQEPVRFATLKEIRVIQEPVQYGSYMVMPAAKTAANLEDASSSSSSSQQSSSSSSSSRQETEVAVAPAPPTPVVLPPDCVPTLQRLIIERPVSGQLVVSGAPEVSSSSSSSSSYSSSVHSSRLVEAAPEPPAVVPPVCCVVKKVAPIYTARLVAPPAPAPVLDGGHSKEEHFHQESRSSREESHGLGHSSSSSSSSSSRSSKSSSSSSTSTTSQTAALVAPPVVTVVRQAAPIVTVKAAPLVAYATPSHDKSNSYSVNVDHHYAGPNVKYGYSIKQQSSEQQQQEPATKGLLVGERVVYLK